MGSTAQKVAELLGEAAGGAVAAIGRTFDLMAIAEEEIAAAKKRFPGKAAELHASFMLLCPNELARYGSDRLYRAHARELLERVARGQDTTLGTDVECLAALSQASLKAPLSRDPAEAMARVFARVFPGQDPYLETSEGESYAGAVDEVLEELRRKIARRDRAAASRGA